MLDRPLDDSIAFYSWVITVILFIYYLLAKMVWKYFLLS